MENKNGTLVGERVFDEVGNVRMIRFQISESQSLEIFNFNSVKFAKKSEYINRGFMHVGFAHNNVYEIREWLKSNNVEIQTDIRVGHDGLKHFFVEDPEKNLIEFTEVK